MPGLFAVVFGHAHLLEIERLRHEITTSSNAAVESAKELTATMQKMLETKKQNQ